MPSRGGSGKVAESNLSAHEEKCHRMCLGLTLRRTVVLGWSDGNMSTYNEIVDSPDRSHWAMGVSEGWSEGSQGEINHQTGK